MEVTDYTPTMMEPLVLSALADLGVASTRRDIVIRAAALGGFSDVELSVPRTYRSSGYEGHLHTICDYAVWHLRDRHGLIEPIERGVYVLTEGGQAAVQSEFGTSYQPSAARPTDDVRGSTWVQISLDAHAQAVTSHRGLELRIVEELRRLGLTPRSPGRGDPAFDVACELNDGSVLLFEVKSLPAGAETQQLRLGVGQLLDYLERIGDGRKTIPVLAVDRDHWELDRWERVCQRANVQLLRPPALGAALATLLRELSS